MNVFYCCCIAEPWLEVAKELNKQTLFPKYWIGWGKDNNGRIQKEFPEATYHDITLAWKGIFPDEIDFIPEPQLDGFELETYSSEELMALKMLDRLDPDQASFTFNERQQFFRFLLRKWITILKRKEIELVVSPSIPHRVFDYAIYIATKILDIEFITFQMTSWQGYLIPLKNIGNIPAFSEPEDNNPLEEDVEDLLLRVRADYDIAEPDYMKKHKKASAINLKQRIFRFLAKKNIELITNWLKPVDTYRKKRGIKLKDSTFRQYERYVQHYQGIKYKNKLQDNYESLCFTPEYDTDYIFVALHYQPELTSCPAGNIFVDQRLMIEALLKVFPEKVKIYVKEHPSQFNPITEGETGRDIDFYDDINSYERVQLISTKTTSFTLIDNAKSIATLTGTVGIEALIRNKPAIIFGNAWYENLPGAFKIDSSELLLELPGKLENFNFPAQEFIKGLNNLYKNCLRANHYKGVKEESNISNKTSVKNLVNYISLFGK